MVHTMLRSILRQPVRRLSETSGILSFRTTGLDIKGTDPTIEARKRGCFP